MLSINGSVTEDSGSLQDTKVTQEAGHNPCLTVSPSQPSINPTTALLPTPIKQMRDQQLLWQPVFVQFPQPQYHRILRPSPVAEQLQDHIPPLPPVAMQLQDQRPPPQFASESAVFKDQMLECITLTALQAAGSSGSLDVNHSLQSPLTAMKVDKLTADNHVAPNYNILSAQWGRILQRAQHRRMFTYYRPC